MNLICISNSRPIWHWWKTSVHCSLSSVSLEDSKLTQQNCAIRNGSLVAASAEASHRAYGGASITGVIQTWECPVPALLPTATGEHWRSAPAAALKGASSGEMLTPHPQLLAQHIPTDKDCGEKVKQKQLLLLIDFSRETCSNYIQGPSAEMNFAAIGNIQITDPR